MIRLLLVIALVVFAWWLVFQLLGWIAGAWGLIPAFIVAMLLAPKGWRQ